VRLDFPPVLSFLYPQKSFRIGSDSWYFGPIQFFFPDEQRLNPGLLWVTLGRLLLFPGFCRALWLLTRASFLLSAEQVYFPRPPEKNVFFFPQLRALHMVGFSLDAGFPSVVNWNHESVRLHVVQTTGFAHGLRLFFSEPLPLCANPYEITLSVYSFLLSERALAVSSGLAFLGPLTFWVPDVLQSLFTGRDIIELSFLSNVFGTPLEGFLFQLLVSIVFSAGLSARICSCFNLSFSSWRRPVLLGVVVPRCGAL